MQDTSRVSQLCDQLSANDANVTTVDLKFVKLSQDEVRSLCAALPKSKHVTKVLLTTTKVGDVGATYLADALSRCPAVVHVDLAFNDITDDAGPALLGMLEANESIHEVMLWGNSLSRDMEKTITAKLRERGPPSGATLVSSKSLTSLVASLQSVPPPSSPANSEDDSRSSSGRRRAASRPSGQPAQGPRSRKEKKSGSRREQSHHSSSSGHSSSTSRRERRDRDRDRSRRHRGDGDSRSRHSSRSKGGRAQRKRSEDDDSSTGGGSVSSSLSTSVNSVAGPSSSSGTRTSPRSSSSPRSPQAPPPPSEPRPAKQHGGSSSSAGGHSTAAVSSATVDDPEVRRAMLELEEKNAELNEVLERLRAKERQLRTRNAVLERKVGELNQSLETSNVLAQSQMISETAKPKFKGLRKDRLVIKVKNITVCERLGETGGSNASVFGVMVDGWLCAMKELDVSNMVQETIDSFQEEIDLLEALPFHPNIVRYLFHEYNNQKIRLYMTRYAGSLHGMISKARKSGGQRWTVSDIARYSMEMLRGLGFLHDSKIIHRDLKSENVFVTLNERGEIASLALGDFDSAKKISRKVQAKTIVGTPQYMSPEVLQSTSATGYTFAADVWSFGMVLYEMLALQIPYTEENHFAIPMLICKGQRPTMPADVPETYKPLIAVFEECTQLQPPSRPTVASLKERMLKLM